MKLEKGVGVQSMKRGGKPWEGLHFSSELRNHWKILNRRLAGFDLTCLRCHKTSKKECRIELGISVEAWIGGFMSKPT